MCSYRTDGRDGRMKCPCKNCLCIPICSHKKYSDLVKCSLLKVYLIDPCTASIRPPKRIRKIVKIIKPTNWYCSFGDKNNLMLVHRDNK